MASPRRGCDGRVGTPCDALSTCMTAVSPKALQAPSSDTPKQKDSASTFGPWLVALGTGLWGTESAFRIPLTESGRYRRDGLYASDVLVLIEHVLILVTFAPWLWWKRSAWPRRISRKALLYIVVSGIAGSAVGTVFFTEALRTGNPTVVNLLLNLQPVVSTIGGWMLLSERPGRRFWLWAPIALGAGLLLSGDPSQALGVSWWGVSTLYTAFCALAWGAGTVVGRGAMRELPLPVASFLRVSVGLVCMTAIVAARGRLGLDHLAPSAANVESWGMLLALATLAGGLPLVIYFRGLQGTPASIAGYFELTQTLTAIVITWGVFGHAMNLRQILAAIVLIAAVTLLQRDGAATGAGRLATTGGGVMSASGVSEARIRSPRGSLSNPCP